jgi:hypothetical protein
MMLKEAGYAPEVEWFEQYANMPHFRLSGPLPECEWLYENVEPNDKGGGFLLSHNNFPWVRFVYIDDPKVGPPMGGALGGEYKLTSGTTIKSAGGWSSRAGVINKRFADTIGDEIVECSIKNDDRRFAPYMAGYALQVNSAILLLEAFGNPFFLTRVERFKDMEPNWVPSIDRYEVVKGAK